MPTRIHEMTRPRSYTGGVTQLRRLAAQLRPRRREAFLSRRVFQGEDYARGSVMLSAPVINTESLGSR